MTADLVGLADLLPCPFCGAVARLDTDVFTTVIQCTNDQCISRCDMGGFNDHGHLQAAITAWNTRSELRALAGAEVGGVLPAPYCYLHLDMSAEKWSVYDEPGPMRVAVWTKALIRGDAK